MAEYPVIGIDEEELRVRLVMSLRKLQAKGINTKLYEDSVDILNEVFEFNQAISPKKRDIIFGNLREYLTKRVETRDAYTEAKTLYNLYKDSFPEGLLLDNQQFEDFIENPQLKNAVSLNSIINVLLEEQLKELERLNNSRTP